MYRPGYKKRSPDNPQGIQPVTRLFRSGDKIFDLGTPNKSFVKVALTLKKLGIKNWYFMLEIKDPNLINVDPYSVDSQGYTNLTQSDITRIAIEISRNPWYYLREVVRIPDPGGKPVPYLANRGNIAQAYCALNGVDSWLNLPRQQGKTMSALALQQWVIDYGTRNSDIIFLNKKREDAIKNLARVSAIREALPSYLKIDSYVDENGKIIKGVNNATLIRNPITQNSITVLGKANSKEAALNLARGLTTPGQHSDETEFTSYIDVIIQNSAPTYDKAAERAAANNAYHARIFTSTPGDMDTKPGVAAEKLLSKTQQWSEKLYDYNEDELYKFAHAEGFNGIVYIEYSWQQLGLTKEWFRKLADEIGDPITARRELLLQRIHGSSNSPYSQADLQYILECGHKPIDGGELILLGLFQFKIYEKLDKRIPYIVACDCATGTLGDNDAITIINPYSEPVPQPVAEFECGYISETRYAALIRNLVMEYIPRACVVIERNHVGSAIIDILMNTEISGNVYFDKAKDLVEEEMKHLEGIENILKKQATAKRYYGVYTEGKSREQMFAILDRHVYEYKQYFIGQNIIRDLGKLVRLPSGKVAAVGDDHDDSIMSYLIGLYVWYHGNNLHAFGIEKGSKDISAQNEGMYIPDINVLSEIIGERDLNKILHQRDPEEDYKDLVRNALLKSQSESEALVKAGLMKGGSRVDESKLDPNVLFKLQQTSTFEDLKPSVDLDMFDDFNNF